MERRGLYDDRAYWKQAIALKDECYDIHYLVISHSENSSSGITAEDINYQVFEGIKYVSSILINYSLKKLLPVQTEFDQLLEEVERIQPDLIQIVDLRILRILSQLKNLDSNPKIIYDIREPRDANLLDLRMKDWSIPLSLKKRYANYIQNWEYEQAGKCDYILGVDDGIKRRIQKNLPKIPYRTIYNFTNLSDSRKKIPIHERKYDAGYVGGLSEIRGVKTIAEATRILVHEYSEIKVLLLGNTYESDLADEVRQFIDTNSLQKNLIWIQAVPYSEVSNYYNDIKIGLNPLKYAKAHEDIIQIKLFEYMNYGIPIITSNFGEMQNYVEENEVGISIEPDQPEILAQAISNMLSDEAKVKQLSENGYNAVDLKFKWEIMKEAYVDIVNELLK